MNHPALRVLLAVLLPLVAATAHTMPALALPVMDAATSPIEVTIDQVTPQIPTLKDTLVLSGNVKNTSTESFPNVRAGLRFSPTPLVGRAEFGQVISGETERIGNRVSQSLQDVDDSLEPGETQPFRVQVPMAELRLPRPGAYVTAVEILADREDPDEMIGLARTFVPWLPDSEKPKPLGLILGMPLAERPAREGPDTFTDDTAPAQMEPEGRLTRLLDAGAKAQDYLTWFIDPDLLDAAVQAANGYTKRAGDEFVPGTHSAAARTWLAKARTILGDRASSTYAWGTAIPEYPAWVRAGLEEQLTGTTKPTLTLGRPLPRPFAYAFPGNVDEGSLSAIAKDGYQGVVAAASSFPPKETSETTVTRSAAATYDTDHGPLTTVLYDDGLRATLAMPLTSPAEASLAVQRFLGETLVADLEQPAQDRTVLALPHLRWNPSPTFISTLLTNLPRARWVRPGDFEALLKSAGSTQAGHVPYTAKQAASELPPKHMRGIKEALKDLDQAAAIVDPTVVEPPELEEARKGPQSLPALTAAVLRTGSGLWRPSPARAEKFADAVDEQISMRINGVRVLSAGNVLFSGESGSIPVTIANTLDVPVHVGLQLTGNPALRFTAEKVKPFTINPNVRTTLEVAATVRGGGSVDVAVQLLTADGQPYGPATMSTVRSTAYSRAASWVIGAAFLTLITLVITNGVRRRIRKARTTR